jgi:DNA-binding transcriptional MocR family regulator
MLNFTEAALPAVPGILEAAQAAAGDLAPHLAGRGFDPVGVAELRQVIAAHYERRGLPTSPDEIVVTTGALSAINLVARAMLARGDRVLVETPTYPHAADALASAGGRLVSASVGVRDGWDEEGFLAALSRTAPVLAYVMPDFQNPTGASMSTGFRQRFMDAAARAGTTVIADETTAELDIDRPGTYPPLAAFGDAILIGSAGKTLWGGLRIGWIRARRSVLRRIVGMRASTDLGTPILDQLVAARLLQTVAADASPRREQLRRGRDFLVERLETAFPEWDVPRIDGGLCVWVNLGRPVSSQLVLSARAAGVLLAAGPRFGLDGAFERFLRMPTGYSPEETVRAVDALEEAWRSLGARELQDRDLYADLV